MIVVREVFQLKFGKARDAKAVMAEALKLANGQGLANAPRVLTDLTGPSYRLVFETQYDSLASYELSMQQVFAMEEWRNWYQKFIPLVENSNREIFTVVEAPVANGVDATRATAQG